MITLHHLNNSRSQRVLWLLEEIGVPYEIKFYQRDTKTIGANKFCLQNIYKIYDFFIFFAFVINFKKSIGKMFNICLSKCIRFNNY